MAPGFRHSCYFRRRMVATTALSSFREEVTDDQVITPKKGTLGKLYLKSYGSLGPIHLQRY